MSIILNKSKEISSNVLFNPFNKGEKIRFLLTYCLGYVSFVLVMCSLPGLLCTDESLLGLVSVCFLYEIIEWVVFKQLLFRD